MSFEGGLPKHEKNGAARLRPATLVYRHEAKEQFPEREDFEKDAINVRFAGPINDNDSQPDAVWGITPENLKILMGSPDRASVVISDISEKNKFSRGYNGCTGIVGMGIDREGKSISFMSHADPTSLLGSKDVTEEECAKIREKLLERIREMVRLCDPADVRFEIVGGGLTEMSAMKSAYERSITYLGDLVESVTHERPMVTLGPNIELGRRTDTIDPLRAALRDGPSNTDVYLDTAHRRIIIVRPEQRNARWNASFPAPRADEWKTLYDSGYGKGDALLPLDIDET